MQAEKIKVVILGNVENVHNLLALEKLLLHHSQDYTNVEILQLHNKYNPTDDFREYTIKMDEFISEANFCILTQDIDTIQYLSESVKQEIIINDRYYLYHLKNTNNLWTRIIPGIIDKYNSLE